MSNLSAALNALASSSIVDFYLPRHPETSQPRRIKLSRTMTVVWAFVLCALAILSRSGGHVVEVGLSIASVLLGAMLGVFLLGTLTRKANESGTIAGMCAGCLVNLLLWLQPRPIAFSILPIVFPKVAWTWFVLIGSLVTCIVGYAASLIFPGAATHSSTAPAQERTI
jgi:Na+/proline symporter